MSQDAKFWQNQISKAKDDCTDFFSQARKCEKLYTENKNYNIFYSNIQTLKASLLVNNPKPDVERRFIKKASGNSKDFNLFLEVAKITESALIYFTEINCFFQKLKKIIEEAKKCGRAVIWITYEPTINQIKNIDGTSEESITDRDISIDCLKYDEFLMSSSIKPWWKARRHILSREEIKSKFNKDILEENLNFIENKLSSRKLAEVWEIWDIVSKRRLYILGNGGPNEFLKESSDPYKLDVFFPCKEFAPLTKEDTSIPVPEFTLYEKKANALNDISAKGDNLENVINYVVITDTANKDNTANIQTAPEGEVIAIQTNQLYNTTPSGMLGIKPLQPAIELSSHREAKKMSLKQDIYDITGISDILRGQTNAQETATAQKIKGLFGSLRFQDQQKDIQLFVVDCFRIIAEIICEHFDAETLQNITSTFFPTDEEKELISQKIAQIEVIKSNPQYINMVKSGLVAIPPLTKQEIKIIEQPSWTEVINLMRNEKLRNYTIDVQSTATVFDDIAEQNISIAALINAYKDIVSTAMQFGNPEIIRGFIPIAKMQLTNIKTGRAVAKQMLESLENAADELDKKNTDNANQISPEFKMKQQEFELKMQESQARIKAEQLRTQAELLKEQNRALELELKQKEFILEAKFKEAAQKTDLLFKEQNIAVDNRNLDIKQQEANRKEKELDYQARLKTAELVSGVNIDTNIRGDIKTLE